MSEKKINALAKMPSPKINLRTASTDSMLLWLAERNHVVILRCYRNETWQACRRDRGPDLILEGKSPSAALRRLCIAVRKREKTDA